MKIKLRAPLLSIIKDLKDTGLDLSSDVASFTMTYPEHPEVLISVSIGGLLFDDGDEDMEVH